MMMICNYVFISIWFWSTFMQIRIYIYIRIYMYIYVKKSVFMQNSMSFFDFLTTTCQVNSTKRQECIHSSRQIPVWPVAPPMAIVVCLDGIVCESILFCFPRYAVIIIKEVPQLRRLHHATFPSAPVFLVTNFIWEKATSKPRASSLTCFSLSLPQ